MINLTTAAAEKIKKSIERRGKGLGIRIGVKTTGCSGLAYVLEYVDTLIETDNTVLSEGCNVFIDDKSVPYLSGLTIDYVKKGLNEGFEFINPNERAKCGCGESFSI